MRILKPLSLLLPLLLLSPAQAGFSSAGHFELDFDQEVNLNLDDAVNEDVLTLQPELQLEFTQEFTQQLKAYVQMEFRKELVLEDDEDGEDGPVELRLEQAYISYQAREDVEAQFGRMEYKDKREWIYDVDLDGVQLMVNRGAFSLTAAGGRERRWQRDLLNNDKYGKTDTWILRMDYSEGERDHALWWLSQNDTSGDDESPWFVGLSSHGDLLEDLRYWLELMAVRGHEGDTDIRGYGFDAMLIRSFDLPYKPALSAGLAFGSGDDTPGDGTLNEFRQTGFQDNDGRLAGLNKFRFYGEAIKPELSNLRIFTLGAGIRPGKKTSLELVYHQYRQDVASDSLRDTDLDVDPDGLSKDLGQGLDLVFGYLNKKQFRIEAVLGYFKPGDAFDAEADDAWFAGFETRYFFKPIPGLP
jgi:alginate production protein